jgi:hypothetical protein
LLPEAKKSGLELLVRFPVTLRRPIESVQEGQASRTLNAVAAGFYSAEMLQLHVLETPTLSESAVGQLHACLQYHRQWLSTFATQASRTGFGPKFAATYARCETLLTQTRINATRNESVSSTGCGISDWATQDFDLAIAACDGYLEHIELLACLGAETVVDTEPRSQDVEDLHTYMHEIAELRADLVRESGSCRCLST